MTDEIRRQLSENFEKYESNTVLNTLTPKRSMAGTSDSSRRLKTTSSTRPGRRSSVISDDTGSVSRRRLVRGSDILASMVSKEPEQFTSPVKARKYASSEEDAVETSVINMPLRGSPKEKMRQGTPKLLSAKSSQRDAVFRNRTLSIRQDKSVDNGPDDEFDDDADGDDDSNHIKGNATILSDIPSELISPEKLRYEKEPLGSFHKSPSTSSPRKATNIPSIYPKLPTPSREITNISSKLSPIKQTDMLARQPVSQSTETSSKPFTSLLSPVKGNSSIVTIHQDEPPNDLKSPPRRISTGTKSIDLSRFESSEEEPVPELTVKLSPVKKASTQKRNILEDDSTSQHKKPKQDKIYPDLTSSTPQLNTVIHKAPLYPKLPSHEPTKSADKVIVDSDSGATADTDPPGDAEHWNKLQWITFIKCFKQFESKDRDFTVFTPSLLSYLRCDERELLLKIGFYKDFEDLIHKSIL